MIEYDKDAIVPPYITEYLRTKTVHENVFLHELEEYAKENKVPAYENYMRGDIELLINCDAIYLLENWGTSKGARLEKKIAEVLKMQIMTD